MSEKKIVVPEGMLRVAKDSFRVADPMLSNNCTYTAKHVLEAALRWMSENPLAPTHEQIDAIQEAQGLQGVHHVTIESACVEWQRRMFAAPEARNFGWVRRYAHISTETLSQHEWVTAEDYDALLEAFLSGQKSR